MPAGGLSTGIDVKISFTDLDGVKQFSYLESFNSKEDAPIDKQVQMDGTTRHPKFHQGWSGTCVFQRGDNFLDNYIAVQEAAYYRGGDQIPLTITQTITEVNGSVTQYQYTKVVIALDDAGTWSGTEIVKQSISFQASRREKRV